MAFARQFAGATGVINSTLRDSSLKSDVNAVLLPENYYTVNVFSDQIEKILESDDRQLSDDMVETRASVAMNRQGGGRRKLADIALDQVIKRKKMSLFCPMNVANNLCLSICLSIFYPFSFTISLVVAWASLKPITSMTIRWR
ncbi:MAG: hypothetical protein ACRC0O_06480 [Vibrio metschnikovii]